MLFFWNGLTGKADMQTIVDLESPNAAEKNKRANFHPNPLVDAAPYGKNQAQLFKGTYFKYKIFSFNLKKIYADGTVNGKLSKNTTQISIDIDARMNSYDMHSEPYFSMKTFKFAAMHVNNSAIETVGESWNFVTGNSVYLTVGKIKRTLQVDLTHIKNLLPLKIGFKVVTENPDLGTFYYDLGYFSSSEDFVKPTIDGTLTRDSTIITGHGTNGNEVTNSVDEQSVIVKNGTYTFKLKSSLAKYLDENDSVTVTESNDLGDTGTAEQKKLSISKTEQNPEFDLEDPMELDVAHLDKIVNELKLNTGESSGAQFAFDYDTTPQAELEKNIEAFNQGKLSEIILPIVATKDGYIRSNVLNVRVTNDKKGLAFGQTFTKLKFGKHTVPLVSTSYLPLNNWEIIVHDHRKEKLAWRINAKVVPSTKGGLDLSNYLWYKSPKQEKVQLSNTDIPIYHQVAKATGADTTISFRSEESGQLPEQNQREISIEAGPQMKVGEYHATIIWTLVDAP